MSTRPGLTPTKRTGNKARDTRTEWSYAAALKAAAALQPEPRASTGKVDPDSIRIEMSSADTQKLESSVHTLPAPDDEIIEPPPVP